MQHASQTAKGSVLQLFCIQTQSSKNIDCVICYYQDDKDTTDKKNLLSRSLHPTQGKFQIDEFWHAVGLTLLLNVF